MTTVEQRRASLDAANQIRRDRKDLRIRIEAGEISAADVLEDWPACIHGCGVFTFLTFLPRIGRNRSRGSSSKAFVLLRKASLTQTGHKRLDELTQTQLERLARVVRDYENSRHPADRGLS